MTARSNPAFDPDRHVLPFFHLVIASSVARSMARVAILTILDKTEEANTIRDLVRGTQVPAPSNVDVRSARFATC